MGIPNPFDPIGKAAGAAWGGITDANAAIERALGMRKEAPKPPDVGPSTPLPVDFYEQLNQSLPSNPVNVALNNLNKAVTDAGLSKGQRAAIFAQIDAYVTGKAPPDQIISLANQLRVDVLTQQDAQVQAKQAETDYYDRINSQERQRTGAIDQAIRDMEKRQADQGALANARGLALQQWAQGIIGGLGAPSSNAASQQQTLTEASNLLPENMRGTAQKMASSLWEGNAKLADAYKNQLATLSQWSPVLNPMLDPNYGQPFTDIIGSLTMQRANAPQYPFYQPPEYDPYAQTYADAAMTQAQAAMLNATTNQAKAQSSPESLLAEYGIDVEALTGKK